MTQDEKIKESLRNILLESSFSEVTADDLLVKMQELEKLKQILVDAGSVGLNTSSAILKMEELGVTEESTLDYFMALYDLSIVSYDSNNIYIHDLRHPKEDKDGSS